MPAEFAQGFDVVRLAVSWGRLEPQRGTWDTAYLDAIDSTVRLLNSHHIYVVLDMHFLDWSSSFGGSGAPSWATSTSPLSVTGSVTSSRR